MGIRSGIREFVYRSWQHTMGRPSTKENNCFFMFLVHGKWPEMAPNRAKRFFFRLIQTLPTLWATWISILRIFNFEIYKFLDFQVPRFPKSGLGLVWAGPSLFGPGLARLGLRGWGVLMLPSDGHRIGVRLGCESSSCGAVQTLRHQPVLPRSMENLYCLGPFGDLGNW